MVYVIEVIICVAVAAPIKIFITVLEAFYLMIFIEDLVCICVVNALKR